MVFNHIFNELYNKRWLAAVCVLAISGCFDAIPADTLTGQRPGAIAGKITDHCSGAALASVNVLAHPTQDNSAVARRNAVTDASGLFRFDELTPGSWRLSFSHTGYQTMDATALVQDGQTSTRDVILPPQRKAPGGPRKLDLLFVVDNSNSMEQEQKALSAAFPGFLDALLLDDRFTLDLRVGVTTTDMGAGPYNLPSCGTSLHGGKLRVPSTSGGCPSVSAPYIQLQSSAGKVKTNVSGDLVTQAFSCLAKVGVGGCGFEQPLSAMLKALEPTTNPGFFRADANLALVLLSDEDDCSAIDTRLFDPAQQSLTDELGPLTSFRCFDLGVSCSCTGGGTCDRNTAGPRTGCKPNNSSKLMLGIDTFISKIKMLRPKGHVYFAAIVGPSDTVEVSHSLPSPSLKPSCQSANGYAVPAVRIKAAVDAFNRDASTLTSGSLDNICAGDLSAIMTNLAKKMASTVLTSPCS